MSAQAVADALRTVLDEILEGPRDPRETWVVSNKADSGVVGTLRTLTAEAAQRPGSGSTTVAAHAAHLEFSLALANRALRGEDPYAGADWVGSWRLDVVDEAGWQALVDGLALEAGRLQEALSGGVDADDPPALMGAIALVAHSAYHLGAIRQLAMAAGA